MTKITWAFSEERSLQLQCSRTLSTATQKICLGPYVSSHQPRGVRRQIFVKSFRFRGLSHGHWTDSELNSGHRDVPTILSRGTIAVRGWRPSTHLLLSLSLGMLRANHSNQCLTAKTGIFLVFDICSSSHYFHHFHLAREIVAWLYVDDAIKVQLLRVVTINTKEKAAWNC